MDYWNIYRDIWNFHKQYSQVQDTDAYWESVIAEADKLYKKYGNSRFAKDLVMAVMSELERIGKELRGNAET